MNRPHAFDRLAGSYQALEYLAFGRDLERARFTLLHHLRDCRTILVLGEGDGRFLEQLVRAAPEARVDCVDASAAMLARAAGRIAGTEAARRVTFHQRELPGEELPMGPFDAAVTLFFLDCFRPDAAAQVMAAVERRLQPDARWLWSDFSVPRSGPARWRARLWLAVLYGFFGRVTGLPARELPPAEDHFAAGPYRRVASAGFQAGLLQSAVWRLEKTR